MNLSTLFNSIPINRLLIYLMIIGLIPLFVAMFFFFSSLEELNDIHIRIRNLHAAAMLKEKKQAANKATKEHFKDADHFYIDKNLESLRFLQPEIANLQGITTNPNFTEDEVVRKRLEFLTGPQNRLSFSEGNVQTTPYFQEVTESLVHPVEVDASDLKQILTLIEDVEIGEYQAIPGRPQLIVLDFKLDKKPNGLNNEVFGLNMKLLKREFK
jgi:hypothetical protein